MEENINSQKKIDIVNFLLNIPNITITLNIPGKRQVHLTMHEIIKKMKIQINGYEDIKIITKNQEDLIIFKQCTKRHLKIQSINT